MRGVALGPGVAEEEGDYNRLFHPQTSLMVKQGKGG